MHPPVHSTRWAVAPSVRCAEAEILPKLRIDASRAALGSVSFWFVRHIFGSQSEPRGTRRRGSVPDCFRFAVPVGGYPGLGQIVAFLRQLQLWCRHSQSTLGGSTLSLVWRCNELSYYSNSMVAWSAGRDEERPRGGGRNAGGHARTVVSGRRTRADS
jgi:hypothetical protein